MLSTGDTLRVPRTPGRWSVGRVLGEGGQGVVYELLPDAPGRERLALKWYRPEIATPEQRAAVELLVDSASPGPSFLWPLALVEGEGRSFGYTMPLLPDDAVAVTDVLFGRVQLGFSGLARACLGLADSFLQLHAEGLCYRDISLGNVFLRTSDCSAVICDNDNVAVDGDGPAHVLGTSRFMAPEVVRGHALPSTATDLYSLSVLIFYLLMVHHPLLGRRELAHECFDRSVEADLFGAAPLFVFDPVDDSNAPDPVAHEAVLRYWPLYPAYVRTLFTKAFTVGLHDPMARVRESVWRAEMARLLDGIVRCRACGSEVLTDDGAPVTCWSCATGLSELLRLEVDGNVLVLNSGTLLVRHHVARDYDYATVLGEVVRKPGDPRAWGLVNRSAAAWGLRHRGTDRVVEPGSTVGLVLEVELRIEGATCRITA